MTAVEKAAYAWWQSKRPTAYEEGEHLATPEVNCFNDWEKRLAKAVAKMVAARGKHG